MKKAAAFLLAALILIGISSCKKPKSVDISEYLTTDNGKEYLILPISGTKVRIEEVHKEYLDRIDIEMLKSAEEKLSAIFTDNENHSGFYLEVYDGRLHLDGEVIKETPTSPVSEGSNPAYEPEHHHRFYREPISK